MIIEQEFYRKSTLEVARNLLGQYLIREINGIKIKSIIVETEAYIGSLDKACHGYNYKKTERTKPLFEDGGISYVYFIYGLYNCFNIVTSIKGEPEAVLIRAVEPLDNLDYISHLRYKRKYNELTKNQIKNLTNGPSKLCLALDITRKDNYKPLYIGKEIYLEYNKERNFEIVETKRVGIDYAEEAKDFLWRYYIKDNPFVSKNNF